MHLDRYKTGTDPMFPYYYNDCHYETAESLIITGILGFCGCGLPETTLLYLRDVLKHLATWYGDTKAYDKWKEDGKKLFVSEGAEYLVWYVLDKAQLTEHGGSVPGWLTGLGKEVLEDLDEMVSKGELS